MKVNRTVLRYFKRKKQSNRGFSLRALARDVDISAPFLSRVLRGEKPMPYFLLLKLGPILEIEHEVMIALKREYQPPFDVSPSVGHRSENPESKAPLDGWDLVNQQAYEVSLRQWFYLAILEFTTLKNYDGSADTIAQKLGISPVSVGIAVRELAAAGFLKEVDEGRFIKTNKKFRWGSSKSIESIRRFHDQMLEKAQIQLRTRTDAKEFERRLITGITLTTSPERINDAKRRLSEFLHELAEDLIDDNSTEVYQLAAQLFPLTEA